MERLKSHPDKKRLYLLWGMLALSFLFTVTGSSQPVPAEIDVIELQVDEAVQEAYGVVFPPSIARGIKGEISTDTTHQARRPIRMKEINDRRIQLEVEFSPEDLQYGVDYAIFVKLNSGRTIHFPTRSIGARDGQAIPNAVSCLADPTVFDARSLLTMSDNELTQFIDQRRLQIQTQRRVFLREFTDRRARQIERREREVGLSPSSGPLRKLKDERLLERMSRLDALSAAR